MKLSGEILQKPYFWKMKSYKKFFSKKDSFLSYHIPKTIFWSAFTNHCQKAQNSYFRGVRTEELTCSSPRLLLSDYDYFAFEWLYISYYHDPFSYLHISYSVVTRREHAKGSLDQIQRRLPSRALSTHLCILLYFLLWQIRIWLYHWYIK